MVWTEEITRLTIHLRIQIYNKGKIELDVSEIQSQMHFTLKDD